MAWLVLVSPRLRPSGFSHAILIPTKGVAVGMPQLEQAVPRSRLARFNEIANILIRNNVWALLRDMTGEGPPPNGHEPAPQRLRRVLEELGPTFIKIGQLLATRPDLVPQRYVEEFKRLYDATTPSPPEEVRRVLMGELGQEPEALFATFEWKPIASASIGQVHRATLRDGTEVAVKVQHVGIQDAMELDFQILRGLLSFVEKTFSASRIWQPSQHLEELRLMLERELDYSYEMRTMQKVAENFRSDPTVHIPRVFPHLSGPRVLVMEYVDGIKFTRLDDATLAQIDRRQVARTVTHAMARQIFVHRLFHADPSPGNMLILASNRVALLDWGAVGIVTERRSKAILRLITGINKGNLEDATDAVIDLCEQRGELDMKRLAIDMERILDFFEREDVSVADPRLLEMIIGLAKRHRMVLPPDFILISRALFQFEGFCRELDPGFDLVEVLDPLAAELVWRNLSSPKHQKELVEETIGEMLRFGRTLPHTLNTVLRKVERNEITTRVELAGLEGIKSAQGRGVLKMAFTVMMAGLLVGLGFVYTSPQPRVGPFLFLAGGVIALWTVVMILWSEAWKGNRE
jgi:ubiquinone biosynthesis protein